MKGRYSNVYDVYVHDRWEKVDMEVHYWVRNVIKEWKLLRFGIRMGVDNRM